MTLRLLLAGLGLGLLLTGTAIVAAFLAMSEAKGRVVSERRKAA
jgi:hypothetical protein